MWWLKLSIYLACHNVCIPSRNEGYKLCLGKGKISHWNNYDNLQYMVYRKFAKCFLERFAHLLSITTLRTAWCYISYTLLLTKPMVKKKSYVFQGIADKKQSRGTQTQEMQLLVFLLQHEIICWSLRIVCIIEERHWILIGLQITHARYHLYLTTSSKGQSIVRTDLTFNPGCSQENMWLRRPTLCV